MVRAKIRGIPLLHLSAHILLSRCPAPGTGAMMAGPVGSCSSHLWVTDDRGAVFVCQDINAVIDSIHSNRSAAYAGLQLPPAAGPSWTRVDGNLEKVAGGFSGLVCGFSGTVFYVRKEVTHDNPTGTVWTKAFCDAVDVSVGNQSVVRRTSQGKLFATIIDHGTVSAPVFLPSWSPVPLCQFAETQECKHFMLDARDNLYLLSPAGEVYGCSNVASSSTGTSVWRLVSKPPPQPNSGFSLFSFFSWGEKGDFFSLACSGSQVASGSLSLWCVEREKGRVWQLVLSEVAGREGNAELKINWIQFDLPKEDTPLLELCADKTKIDSLYAIADEGKALVGYSLLQENSGRLTLSGPGEGDSAAWRSITVCQTQRPQLSAEELQLPPAPAKKQYTSSLYPKLPRSDLCCEEGDCEFCRAAAMPQSVLGGRKQQMKESCGEDQFYTCLPPPKRPHLLNPRLTLLEGVDVRVKSTLPPRLQQALQRQHESQPLLTVEQVEARFGYSFELERKVLEESSRELHGSHHLTSYHSS